MNNGKSDTCGAVHITIGDGGNKEGLAHKYVSVLKRLSNLQFRKIECLFNSHVLGKKKKNPEIGLHGMSSGHLNFILSL